MQNKFLVIFLISLGVICGLILFFGFRILEVKKQPPVIFVPHPVNITLLPPTQAITAQILSVKGKVEKQARTDNAFQPLTQSTTLLQGESLATLGNGQSKVVFGKLVSLTLSGNTQLDYVNALPQAMVVRQPNGTINYAIANTIPPFSIRSLGLLIQFRDQAQATVTTSAADQTVALNLLSGKATLAYSDANNNTQVTVLSKSQKAVFDYSQQSLKVD